MEEITTIGLDIAKSVFQVHGIDASGVAVVCRQLRRRQVLPFFRRLSPCLVGIEACATSHHWAREIAKLGHEVRLMPVRYVKPYVKRNKNDAADAEAICEAVTRPTMRFVAVKTTEQQSVLMLHRTRQLFVRQRTALINAIRAHLAEFGIVAGVGRNGVEALLELIAKGEDERVPPPARACLIALARQLALIKREIVDADRTRLRIEASDTTFWYGFTDDVVIRVRAAADGAGSRIDVRSLSRVGRSDVGKNAARIRAFIDALAP